MVHNTDKALTKTCEQLNCKALHYTVAPVYLSETSGKHQWLIEFEQKPKDLFQFAQKLDINIKELNSDYAAKRSNDIILALPEVISLKKKTFYKWLAKKNRLGGQFKIPKLLNERTISEEILHINK